MATVPDYRQQVQPGAMPSVRQSPSASPAAFGGGLQGLVQAGKELQSAGQSIDRIVMENMEDDNKRAARTAFNEAAEKVRTLRGEYRNRKGYNAKGVTAEADKAFADIASQATKSMNQRQKDLFAARWDGFRQSELGTLDMRERDEVFKADDASDMASILGAQQDAASSYTNKEAVRQSMMSIEIASRDRAARNGWDAAVTEQYVKEQKTKARAMIFDQMIADDRPEMARELLDTMRDTLDPTVSAKMQKVLDAKDDEKIGSAYGEALFRQGATLTDAMERIREQFPNDPERQRHARAEFRSWRAADNYERREAYTLGLSTAIAEIDAMSQDLAGAQAYVNNLPARTPEEQKIKKAAQSRAAYYIKAGAGVDFATDVTKWGEMLEGITSGTLNSAADMREKYAESFTAKDLKAAERLLDASQKVVIRDIKDVYLQATGRASTTGSDSVKRDYGAFQRWAAEQVRLNNKGGDQDFLQRLGDMWVMRGEREGGFAIGYGMDMTLGQAIARGEADKWLPDDVPAGFWDALSPEVQKQYTSSMNGDNGLAARRAYYDYLQKRK